MAQLRAAAKELVDACLSQQVKFPKRWKRPKINQACRATLMLNNTDTGFDQRAALDYMKLKYGTGNGPTTDKKPQKKRQKKAVESTEKLPAKEGEGEIDGTPPKRRRRGSHGGGGNDETSPDFHPKKYEIVEVEDNRPLVEAIKELGALHYRANEPKKGTHYMMVVKQIRQCKHPITDRESALQLKGVAEHMADHIVEFLKTGDIKHFEELRERVRKTYS